MSNLPKNYTQEDQTAKDVEAWNSGSERERLYWMPGAPKLEEIGLEEGE